jgi:prophage regulatory protein
MNGLIRFTDVAAAVALSKTELYRRIRRGEFPQPVRIGARAVAWRESDLREWLDTRPAARAGGAR